MSLLSYNRLCELVESGVITAKPEQINGASIDITLDNTIMVEIYSNSVIDLHAKDALKLAEININDGWYLSPGDFILAASVEIFNLPNNIACEYKLKSSLARSGLNHMLAGWCDPGWHGSKLTLELQNTTKHHILKLTPGMKIGQMVFFECEPIPDDQSYAKKGQYNQQMQVTANKGLR